MPLRRRHLPAIAALAVAAALAGQFAEARKKDKAASSHAMDEQRRAIHALNRLTFGPRPGDVERVKQMGVDQWIELQLHPEKIEDAALRARLEPFRTLVMPTKEIVENFPPNELIKQVANGKLALPSNPTERAIYEAQLQRLEDKQERKEKEKATKSVPQASDTPATDIDKESAASNPVNDSKCRDGACPVSAGSASTAETEQEAEPKAGRSVKPREERVRTEALLNLPPNDRIKEILQMSPEDQRALDFKGPKADALTEGMSPQQKEIVMALNNPEQVVANELMQAKLMRAIYSERQLDEVMTDFWFNHFNVFINKGSDRYLLTSYERDAIRPHALGKFEDLLVATAKSPAMMFYLDNWLSVGPHSDAALGIAARNSRARRNGGPPRKAKGKRNSGLNENYGRELMELHTLSVNGGYSQEDVTEVAKVFTGWTIEQPAKGGDFHFDPRMHEPGDKMVLGQSIKENGEKEGLKVLHLLAKNPKTAHFVSQKLAMRFVSDEPPAALVDRMSETFLKKHGDIREVLRTMFKSPEFWAPETYRAKVKTPLEFVVSAVRASGANVDDARQLVGTLNNMGMMLYGMQPPTGYSMKAETWVNSSALLGRMNFALGLANGRVRGVRVDPEDLAGGKMTTDAVKTDGAKVQPDPQQSLAMLESSLLNGDISQQTHATISKQLEDPKISQRRLDDPKRPPNTAAITGLLLGSPEFQRR